MNIEQTNKFFIDASFNHLIEVKNNGDALLTIHNDGTITAAEHLKPTETAAEVLRIMRETWMADAQSIKIRDQQERIKRLEEALGTLVKMHRCFVGKDDGITHERSYYCFYKGQYAHWQQAIDALEAKEAKL